MEENIDQNITVSKVVWSFVRIAIAFLGIILILLAPFIVFLGLFALDATKSLMYAGVASVLFTVGILLIIKAVKPSFGRNQNTTTETQKNNIIGTTLTVIGLLVVSIGVTVLFNPAFEYVLHKNNSFSNFSTVILYPITVLSIIYIGNRNYSIVKKALATVIFSIFFEFNILGCNFYIVR